MLGAPGGATTRFALATCLSTVCRTLDVEVVTDFNTGQSAYWGRVGHYKIAGTACGLVASTKLRTLLTRRTWIASPSSDGDIGNGEVQKRFALDEFAPLADVPDLKWKRRGASFARPKDGPDALRRHGSRKGSAGSPARRCWTCARRPRTSTCASGTSSTPILAAEHDEPRAARIAAFPRLADLRRDGRVRAAAQKLVDFVCAAGILAHYIGDACQPLHTSQLHDGPAGEHSGVHSAFETTMLDKLRAPRS